MEEGSTRELSIYRGLGPRNHGSCFGATSPVRVIHVVMLPHPAKTVNFRKRKVSAEDVVLWLPLTLTLSPRVAGRGD